MDEVSPIQRKYLGLCCYTPILIFYYYVSRKYDTVYEKDSPGEAFNNLKRFSKFYLTGWNFSSQVYFMFVAISDELAVLCELPHKVRNALNLIRNYLFTAIVFPCSVLVTILFWFLYFIDRELVFPKSLDEHYLPWMVHSVHSFIILPLAIEIYSLEEQQYQVIDFYYALPILTVFCMAYKFSLLMIYFIYDVWLYPVFKYLTWWQRLLFLFILYCSTLLFLFVGIHLQQWRRRIKIIQITNM